MNSFHNVTVICLSLLLGICHIGMLACLEGFWYDAVQFKLKFNLKKVAWHLPLKPSGHSVRSRGFFLPEIHLSQNWLTSDGTIANMIFMIFRQLEKAPFARPIFSDTPLRHSCSFSSPIMHHLISCAHFGLMFLFLSFIRPPCLIQDGPQLPGIHCPHCDRQLWRLRNLLCGPHGQRPQDLQQPRTLP